MSGLTAAILGFVSVAYAASGTISLSPAAKTVSPGQTVAVTITVNPSAGSVYTVKAKIAYPANLLEVQSFTFSDGWLPLSQTGYDLTDNVNGVLIKTAGYGGGLSASKVLGTITFKVKTAGTATVTVASDSMLLDSVNGNVFSGSSSSTLTSVVATSPTVSPTASPTATVRPSPRLTTVTPTPAATTPGATPGDQNQTALIAGAGKFLGLANWIWWIILAVVVLSVISLWLRRRRTSRPQL